MPLLPLLLHSLSYPRADAFNPDDPAQFQDLVVFLEVLKVRHYLQDGVEQQQLRSPDPAQWQAALQQYLMDLGCPISPTDGANHRAALHWLLRHAGAPPRRRRQSQSCPRCLPDA